jgi:hypothetical protein
VEESMKPIRRIEQVLEAAGRPMSIAEIAAGASRRSARPWPVKSVEAALAGYIQRTPNSQIVQLPDGKYTLRSLMDNASKKNGRNTVDLMEEILAEAGVPLNYREVTARLQANPEFSTVSSDPASTVNAMLGTAVGRGRLARYGPGLYGVPGLPEPAAAEAGVAEEPRAESKPRTGDTPNAESNAKTEDKPKAEGKGRKSQAQRGRASRGKAAARRSEEATPRQTTMDLVMEVLHQAGAPLSVREILTRLEASGKWQTKSRNPEDVLSARLATVQKQAGSGIVRVAPGVYAIATVAEAVNETVEPEREQPVETMPVAEASADPTAAVEAAAPDQIASADEEDTPDRIEALLRAWQKAERALTEALHVDLIEKALADVLSPVCTVGGLTGIEAEAGGVSLLYEVLADGRPVAERAVRVTTAELSSPGFDPRTVVVKSLLDIRI